LKLQIFFLFFILVLYNQVSDKERCVNFINSVGEQYFDGVRSITITNTQRNLVSGNYFWYARSVIIYDDIR